MKRLAWSFVGGLAITYIFLAIAIPVGENIISLGSRRAYYDIVFWPITTFKYFFPPSPGLCFFGEFCLSYLIALSIGYMLVHSFIAYCALTIIAAVREKPLP